MGPLWLTVTHGAFPEWSHDFLKVKDPPLIIHACKLLIVSFQFCPYPDNGNSVSWCGKLEGVLLFE